MRLLAGLFVVALGVYLTGLAVLILIQPRLAERFLRLFASSARAHYTEHVLRLAAGGAVILFAPSMRHPDLFRLFGWLLAIPAVVLLLLPWRWHQEFGRRAGPLLFRYLKLYALGAFALGAFIIYGLYPGN